MRKADKTNKTNNKFNGNMKRNKCILLLATVFACTISACSGGSSSGKSNSHEINGHEYVDLGLSVKWATCNVGAFTPSDFGSYFAWGETTIKREYDNNNCKTFQKKLGDIAGDPNYDAARANWGGTWRLPTKEEFDELIGYCQWEWRIMDGRTGYLVTGLTGNRIFLPAAGYRSGSYIKRDNGLSDCGVYWTSTPDDDGIVTKYNSGYAHCLSFCADYFLLEGWGRDEGLSIRPVSE